jgi:hypothetical protein
MQAACSFLFLLFDLINLVTFSEMYNVNISHYASFSSSCHFLLSRPTHRHILRHMVSVLVIGPSIVVYIFTENQQKHKNDNFIVMLSQTLLHVSAYQSHHQGAHMVLTSYLYVGVHYRKNSGISSEVAPIIITPWI